mgnify:FL=1|jgi:hypothetical protein
MFKRSISLLCSFLIITLVFPFSAFAAGHTHTFGDNKRGLDMNSLPEGYSVPVTFYETPCTSGCGYSQYSWTFCGASGYYVDKSGLDALTVYSHYRSWFDGIYGKNSTATKFEAGGGQPGTGGAGRYPSGYTSDGVPSVSTSGKPTLAIPHSEIELDFSSGNVYPNSYCSHSGRALNTNIAKHVCVISGNKLVSTSYPKTTKNFTSGYARYYFKAPVDGYYRVVPFTFSLLTTLEDGTSSSTSFSSGSSYSNYHYYAKGSSVPYSFSGSKSSSKVIHASYIGPAYISVEYYSADGTSGPTISSTTNITINNNTWNGNIYQDTENNLTYIYPQYTTINDAGDTITNISENPIIYNSTTNQYYTYDSTTNNYYYITYVTATPEPTASHEPTASPDPGTTPTPTPTPGGDTGDTSGLLDLLRSIKDSIVQGFADLTANIKLAIENLNINIKNYFDTKLPDRSTPETATTPTPAPAPSATPEPTATPEPSATPEITPTPSPEPTDKPSKTTNFWTFIFGGGSDDGTDKGHKGILWALISLILAIISLLTGLGASAKYLFPFLPSSVITTIHICVIVLFLFAVIKFIRSFL